MLFYRKDWEEVGTSLGHLYLKFKNYTLPVQIFGIFRLQIR